MSIAGLASSSVPDATPAAVRSAHITGLAPMAANYATAASPPPSLIPHRLMLFTGASERTSPGGLASHCV